MQSNRVQTLDAAPDVEPAQATLQAHRDAAHALRRGYRWIAGLTWLYRLGALGYFTGTLIAVGALATPQVPVGPGILVVVLCSALSVGMLMAAIQILFKPFVWTLVIATLATIVSIVHFIGPDPLGLASIFSAAWAVVFWACLVPTLRFRRLMAEHMDLYIEHHAGRMTKKSLKGRSPEQRHERLTRAMDRAFHGARKSSATAAGVMCAIAALGTAFVLLNLRPQELSAALARFEGAWNNEGLAAVGRLFPQQVAAQRSEWLAGVVRGHGWGSAPPRLMDTRIREEEEGVWAEYQVDDLTLSTHWALSERKWMLLELDLPVPPFEPVHERFLRVWRSSDLNAVAAFYPAGFGEKQIDTLRRNFERRGWQVFPEISDTVITESSEGDVVVLLTVPTGDVRTQWLFRGNGEWSLNSLKLPKF